MRGADGNPVKPALPMSTTAAISDAAPWVDVK
jgi:hypothetical protein